jgi:hypothetical protein
MIASGSPSDAKVNASRLRSSFGVRSGVSQSRCGSHGFLWAPEAGRLCCSSQYIASRNLQAVIKQDHSKAISAICSA